MTRRDNRYYDELDARFTRGELPPEQSMGPILRGDAAAAVGRGHLMQATGTTSVEEAVAVALGRPRRSAVPTITFKTVMPVPMLQQVRDLARREQVSAAQVVRSAVADYLVRAVA